MLQHNLEYYLNEYETLTPADTMLGDVADTEWWDLLKPQFDDLIWLYYPQRTLFLNDRFKPEDHNTTYNNILRYKL